ncbi:isoprenylcysteine carboxylmethyltransferase family protein [Xanthomonas albilineans]|uniref:isoprenylcysteine carboxylmethyltransferase family protein n=1 Tax=Xanthomonas albilineans TaxID=29447 RepID=UPI000B1C8E3B|nr:isoprenylcysteine carboxylmethyltransferase family protein [Xanthomonas albilineans]
MSWLETRLPTQLAMALCGVTAWGLSRIDAGPASLPDAGSIGIVIVLAGVIFNVAPKRGFQHAGPRSIHCNRNAPHTLVQSCLHRWSRNPIYLGHALILLELALCLRHALALLAVSAYMQYAAVRLHARCCGNHSKPGIQTKTQSNAHLNPAATPSFC